MELEEAKKALDKIITKARVHFYKPIQIAEILYRDRVYCDITISDLETYRNISKKWRDKISLQFLGRISTSSAKYQDDIFNNNAVPPRLLNVLSKENKKKKGIVEAYIYKKFFERFSKMSSALSYCEEHLKDTFELTEFLNLFWKEAGLRRSIDKIYEIVVYSLFSALVEAIEVTVEVKYNSKKKDILKEFEDFSKNVLLLSLDTSEYKQKAKINRVGVTNAADRGLDMWANFGMAIQIKHLSLTEELAHNIVSSITADRIIIVCKDAEEKIIVSLLNQIGWKSKIQSIITESNLVEWYEKALRGKYADSIANIVLTHIKDEILKEFPATDNSFLTFYQERNYNKLKDKKW
ncbi:HaeII family restriction endonuclease [Capnocytophaga sp. oral taxon 902]|uniref:HaeII family restriction endonuclease n=1 Tax=Capnocytophaga sp. oral taxon 902 TaxID=2748316 RepID=UPI0015BDEBB1|nr:HaeII family restriction endonuclease [Capnocytophaga sp. oral taxon 902]QLF49986.1 HaeII family restriction endonuclease [Capnocytophaga sp. oral taxon 902]